MRTPYVLYVGGSLGTVLKTNDAKHFDPLHYIDDVSSSYVSFDELLASGGPLAAALSNRTGEYFNTGPVIVETGTSRGDSSDNDWYLNTSIYFSYRLGSALPVVPSAPLPVPTQIGL